MQIVAPKGAQNRRLIGTDLHSAIRENSPNQLPGERRLCGTDIIFNGRHGQPNNQPPSKDPALYDSNEWVDAPYYDPISGQVHALMHHEFKEAGDPFCSFGDIETWCWFSSVTYVRSDSLSACPNGASTPNTLGACYSHSAAPPPSHLVATIPYQYYKNWGRQGYSAFTNPLKEEGGSYYYFLVNARACLNIVDSNGQPSLDESGQPICDPDKAHQETGVCVLRTNDISNPSSWQAWNGVSFDNRPSGAYPTPPADPNTRTCKPVAPRMPVWNLTYNQYLDKYMVLGHGNFVNAATGQAVRGVYYSLSDDLINWSEPQLVMKAPTINDATVDCNLDQVSYPVLLDPDDPAASWTPESAYQNPNFDHPDRGTDIYFRQKLRKPSSCETEEGSNLSRLPIEFNQRQATFEGDTITANERGFDSTSSAFVFGGGPNDSVAGNGYGEGSSKFVRAQMYGSFTNNPSPSGSVNVAWERGNDPWNQGDDVWYGSAFRLPPNFLTGNGNTDILRWDSTGNQDFGAIGMRISDRRFHLVSGGSSGFGTDLTGAFDLPLDRWFWLEVHQRFGQNAGESPINEVYVDGRLVATSTQPNRQSANAISKLSAGFAKVDTSSTSFSSLYMDRLSILGGQKGAVKGTAAHQAPATPTGLRTTFVGSQSVGLTANTVSNATGYRLWRKQNGVWVSAGETALPGWVVSASACTAYEYRVTAYRKPTSGSPEIDVSESIASRPLGVTTTGC